MSQKYTHSSDEELIEIIKRGRLGAEPAVEEIYRRYYQALVMFIHGRNMVPLPDAEDLAVECFVKALRAVDRFDPGVARFKAWMFGIARHARCDFFRRSGKHVHVSLESCSATVEEGAGSDSRLRVREALGKLCGDDYELIMLKYFEGFTEEEIGRLLSLPTGSVSRKLTEVRHRLRNLLVDGAPRTVSNLLVLTGVSSVTT
jgi:RNA polymerase sigma factor (sigma-70 family)